MTLQIEIIEGRVRNFVTVEYASCATISSLVRMSSNSRCAELIQTNYLEKKDSLLVPGLREEDSVMAAIQTIL